MRLWSSHFKVKSFQYIHKIHCSIKEISETKLKQSKTTTFLIRSMSKSEIKGEALNSPLSRVYLCPETEQIMNCAMKFKYPVDVDAFKRAFSNSILIKHPRFCSLIVRTPDEYGGEHWKTTHVNIDDHFIIHHYNPPSKNNKDDEDGDGDGDGDDDDDDDDGDAAVNAYLAEIAVSTPLSANKPLWEVHVLVGLKCVVLRVHHALGDGVSLMSMLSACFGKKSERNSGVVVVKNEDQSMKNQNTKNAAKKKGIWELMKSIWLTFIFGLKFLGRFLWVNDKESVLSGGDGVELWPRKLVTAKFKVEDFKSIKLAIPNATVNDALLGIISHGISMYLGLKSPEAVQQSLEFTGILVVNLRCNSCSLLQEMSELMSDSSNHGSRLHSWGNKTGLVLLPICCSNKLHPLDHVRAMKATMDQKKHSDEAHLSHWALKVITSHFGPKIASWCCHRVLCNTTLLISNIMGPSEEIMIADNPVKSMKVTISGQPHAITMHMVSYAGQANLQVMVAKDIIHDPEFLVKCFHDSLVELKTCINSMN